MGEVIRLERANQQPYTNEDSYRGQIIDALSALQSGRTKEAEAALQDLLTDVETVLAGGEI